MARPDAWFRFYNTTVDNPKVQRLSPVLFMAWVNLLCIASKRAGSIDPDAVDFALRTKTGVALAWLKSLAEKGLFDANEDGTYTPHDWNDLQYKQSPSTERVKRHRDKMRNADETQDETVTETVTVTVPEKSIAEHSREESPKPPRGPVELPKDFLKFWEAYPDKVGQKAALKAWKNAKDKPELASILSSLDRYVRTKPTDRAWCNPATWLNQGRWNDNPASTVVPMISADPEDSRWRLRVDGWTARKFWNRDLWGPTPDEPGCRAPTGLLQTQSERLLSAG